MNQFSFSPIRFLAGLLFFLCSVLISWFLRGGVGWTIDAPLATLLGFAFYGSRAETFFLSGLAAWILNWTHAVSLEILLLIALPLIVSYVRTIRSPLGKIPSLFLVIVFGTFVFYAIAGGRTVLLYPAALLLTALVSGLWGTAVFVILERGMHNGRFVKTSRRDF